METFKSDRKRLMRSECIPEFIVLRPAVISVAYTFKMAVSDDGNNICTFMEEIQKYDCIYNKYSRDYKKKIYPDEWLSKDRKEIWNFSRRS